MCHGSGENFFVFPQTTKSSRDIFASDFSQLVQFKNIFSCYFIFLSLLMTIKRFLFLSFFCYKNNFSPNTFTARLARCLFTVCLGDISYFIKLIALVVSRRAILVGIEISNLPFRFRYTVIHDAERRD
jgi:hypothetical protein